ncbi:hypothetical protein L1987_31492 [Smallanthus sonchifolius]|uniref:Uncharacterized protein n=2 Tax=Smallanthus sonchifolius TaxID=185202 RepID=A0ACB9I750_9ASTR|nr:hypothetical protein L1987_59073 [Smallanthus sonchifolius]KAI3803341.1 hypothetical protein L1987_31492 [Smallanthus sonchifolius]
MEEISKLQYEAHEIPQRLRESCKAVNEEIFSIFQSLVADDKCTASKLFSRTSEFVTFLMSTFEANVSVAMDGFTRKNEGNKSSSSISSRKTKDEYKVDAWTKLSTGYYMPILILFIILVLSMLSLIPFIQVYHILILCLAL